MSKFGPIHGSILNPPAKLYKRYTTIEEVDFPSDNTVKIQGNYYSYHGDKIKYIETDDLDNGEYKPITGMLVSSYTLAISFHGPYKPDPKDKSDPKPGDILQINDEFWIIQEGISRSRCGSVKNLAIINAAIQKLL